ncbi:MAG TPA: GH3 auxin-responsive promoter family protein [Anaerolineae bacterium]|nr:GH3 auxin-responsive promoter family protein [Anaerolineae bacterium]
MTQYAEFVELFVNLWHEGLHDPARTQAQTLAWLLDGYTRTLYGQQHNAAALCDLAAGPVPGSADPASLFDAYRRAFPIVTYDRIKPWIDRVVAGEVHALLPEPPVAWAMTRGTTRGTPKRIPITQSDLGIRVAAARALLNHLLRTGQLDAIDGYCLNLNYPSVMGTMTVAGQETPYGFSSGIYIRHAAEATPVEILPPQQEIDALGGGTSRADWQRRFEMVYQRTQDAPVTMCAGVCPSIIEFGHYLHQRHKLLPKDLWSMRALAATSVPGIHTRWAPALRALYGHVDIVEMYIATEGTFAQQRDDRRLLVPNLDLYFFEVLQKGGKVKMLHDMRPGEIGSLVVSTPVLPRYRIGDLIRAFDPPYFRCIGREGRTTRLRYWLEGIAHLDFGRA